jgi:hypothetical protein
MTPIGRARAATDDGALTAMEAEVADATVSGSRPMLVVMVVIVVAMVQALMILIAMVIPMLMVVLPLLLSLSLTTRIQPPITVIRRRT